MLFYGKLLSGSLITVVRLVTEKMDHFSNTSFLLSVFPGFLRTSRLGSALRGYISLIFGLEV